MSAILVELADAIATKVAALTWGGGAFTVASTYASVDELLEASDSEDARVDVVVPDGFDQVELETRGSVARQVTVEVVLRRRFGVADQATDGSVTKAQVDSLVELAEAIGLAATYARLADFPDAAWLETAQDPLFSRERLRQHRQFFSLTLLTFEISTDL